MCCLLKCSTCTCTFLWMTDSIDKNWSLKKTTCQSIISIPVIFLYSKANVANIKCTSMRSVSQHQWSLNLLKMGVQAYSKQFDGIAEMTMPDMLLAAQEISDHTEPAVVSLYCTCTCTINLVYFIGMLSTFLYHSTVLNHRSQCMFLYM